MYAVDLEMTVSDGCDGENNIGWHMSHCIAGTHRSGERSSWPLARQVD